MCVSIDIWTSRFLMMSIGGGTIACMCFSGTHWAYAGDDNHDSVRQSIHLSVLAAVWATQLWYEAQWAARWGMGKLLGSQIWTYLTKPSLDRTSLFATVSSPIAA